MIVCCEQHKHLISSEGRRVELSDFTYYLAVCSRSSQSGWYVRSTQVFSISLLTIGPKMLRLNKPECHILVVTLATKCARANLSIEIPTQYGHPITHLPCIVTPPPNNSPTADSAHLLEASTLSSTNPQWNHCIKGELNYVVSCIHLNCAPPNAPSSR